MVVLLLLAVGLSGCGKSGQAIIETDIGHDTSMPGAHLSREGVPPLDTQTAPSALNDTNAASISQQPMESGEHIHFSSTATLRLMRTPDGKAFVVRVDNVRDLYAVDMTIRFDATHWQVADADMQTSGIQIQLGEAPRPDFVAVNNVDNTKGLIRYIVTQLGDATAFNGSGTVAAILGQTLIPADIDISVEMVTLVNRNAQAIEVVVR
ncbi:MAG: cohesin domain-containing protein [Anaerolineae bacterium]|nr:cohesin domain-containing protein [Anaerolineae bacterium]